METHPRFEVCAEIENGIDVIEHSEKLKPDVVLTDVNMPHVGGLAAVREIKAKAPESAIVILSTDVDQEFIEVAKKAGARAYVAYHSCRKGFLHEPDHRSYLPLFAPACLR